MILVSPAEPPKMKRALETLLFDHDTGELLIDMLVNGTPERKGVDFAWSAQGEWWGVQRKEIADFLASVEDGRLTKERLQMASEVTLPHVIIEGTPSWTTDGMLLARGWNRPITFQRFHGHLFTLGWLGVRVSFTRNVAETAKLIVAHYNWSQEPDHTTAQVRPKPPQTWGDLRASDTLSWLLQSFEGVGRKKAETLIAAAQQMGKPLIKLNWTREEMMSVDGIGVKIADSIWYAFNAGEKDAREED